VYYQQFLGVESLFKENLRMKKFMMAVCVLWVGFLVAFGAMAKDFEDQKPFNQSELQKFVDDWPGFAKWAEEKGEKYHQSPTAAEGYAFSKEMESYFNKIGWKPERFFYVYHHVSAGLVAIEMKDQAQQSSAELEAQKAAIMANPDIPADQKKQILDQLNQMTSATGNQQLGVEIPPEEMRLIRANKDMLMDLFQGE
jgi:hypothetical protein